MERLFKTNRCGHKYVFLTKEHTCKTEILIGFSPLHSTEVSVALILVFLFGFIPQKDSLYQLKSPDSSAAFCVGANTVHFTSHFSFFS